MFSSYFYSSPLHGSFTYQLPADSTTTGSLLLGNADQPHTPPLYMDSTAIPLHSSTTMSAPAPSLWLASPPVQVTPPLYVDLTSSQTSFRRLGLLIDADHPPLSVLIETLRKLNYEARAALKRLEEDPDHARVLQKRDEERRTKIVEEMNIFEVICQNGASQEEIEQFCSRMSRYVTNTSV